MSADILVDDFLEHFGVKGMKWGVRKSSSSKSGSTTVAGTSVTRDEVRQAGLTIAKKAARYGAPPAAAAAAALASPIALPSVVALGLSAKILMDPDAQAAIKAGGAYAQKMFRSKDGIIEEWSANFGQKAKYGTDITDRVDKMTEGRGLPADKDGPMFNPDAKLDTSRIRDTSDSSYNDWANQNYENKWKLPW